MGDLIDFSTDDNDAPPQQIHHSMTDPPTPTSTQANGPIKSTKSPPPSKPSKPLALRPAPPASTASLDPIKRKPAPPPPRLPGRQNSSTLTSTTASADTSTLPTEPSPLSQIHNSSSSQSIPTSSPAPPSQRRSDPPPSPPSSYRASVRNKVASAYNSLPSWYPPEQSPPPGSSTTRPPPPVPPRRNITSVPAAVAGYATSRLSSGAPSDHDFPSSNGGNEYGGEILTKKEELWVRRWERAKQLFDEKGVVLRSWRVGEDVADGCVRLVEGAMREQRDRRGDGGGEGDGR